MMDSITQAALSLAQSAGVWGYWFALLAALAETAFLLGLLVPGSALLLLMGMLAGQGVFDLGDLLFFAIAGATLGDNLNYFLGRRYGRNWLRQDRWFLKAEHMGKAERFFHNHGGKSVFLGRFVPSVKEIMPFIAGMAGMERRSFMIWNLAGAVGWSVQWILPGYLFSQSLSLAQAWLSRVGVMALILVIVLVLLYGLRWSLMRYGPSGFQFLRSIVRSVGAAIHQNPEVVNLARRFPKATRIIKRRFSRDSWKGLPVTLAGVCGLYVLFVFAGLAEDVVTGDAVTAIDLRVNSLLASIQTPFFNQFFYAVTSLGFWPLVVSGMFTAMFWLWYREQSALIFPLIVSVGSCELLTLFSKLLFHRPRPVAGLIDTAGFSFPSGHASISVAFYGFAIYLAMRSARLWRTRLNLLILALLVAFLIGFSRIYLGVHYFSDVVAGYLVGSMGLLLGIAATYLNPIPERWFEQKFELAPALRLAGAISGFAAFAALLLMTNAGKIPLTAQPESVNRPMVQSEFPQIVLQDNSNQASSVFGNPEAPINTIFVARNLDQIRTCLLAAGWLEADPIHWGSVVNAYLKVAQEEDYPTAPLSPWFWNANSQTLGLVQPGQQGRVFDRSFLRVWSTNHALNTGEGLYVATVGREEREPWHLVPQSLPSFNQEREILARKLRAGQVTNDVYEVPYPDTTSNTSGINTPPYDGDVSVINLATECQ
ncbi:bifunctional DedA family/phosphatase PAP2 family protein [Marinobacter sp.]|jgi:undecaprenyl-diphosphatase|uniref:bifunctional DedA family/phosphatase PAP2 family protein n=1 Tax=Marinobacter sp. TaxID=50741 RepID=UPI002625E648|nr:bifunctional DedA family/phosphatase PAP2 family protein [Marinobacter sp.]